MLPHSDPRSDSHTKTLGHLRRLSYLLDNAIPIPGTNYRLGLDPLLGLIPGGGDTVGALLSVYIVARSASLGLPADTLRRMVFNIIVELLAGTIPVLGDIFDVTWRSNVRNMKLLEAHVAVPVTDRDRAADRWFVLGLLLLLLLVVLSIGLVMLVFVRVLLGLILGQ
jgi:Domain of unknown function (DUF4112)